MSVAVEQVQPTKGARLPRIAPPMPALSRVAEFKATAEKIDIKLFPWQLTAARYLTALGPGGHWLYPEVAIIVGRQNGKTTLLLPLIVSRLLAGARIMHTAQNRELPREIHDAVATLLAVHFPDQLPKRRGVRYGAGQEEIRLNNGGHYRIVAPTKGGARGPSNDLVIVDELREMEDHGFIAAGEPTLSGSPNPQMVFLSNAGTESSVVLNGLRERADVDPALAYLEWSAAPDRADGDLVGWAQANPSIGYLPGKIEYLRRKHTSYRLEDKLSIFETEHLCRWVSTVRRPLVAESAWDSCQDLELEPDGKAFGAVAMDPSGMRASAAMGWRAPDGTIGLRLLFDVTGDYATGKPINFDRLGPEIRAEFQARGVRLVGFDPLTDSLLSKHFPRTEPVAGMKHANASARFATAVETGTLHWRDASAVGADLKWTAKKAHDESGSFQAVRADDSRPITAALAAIRAVYLASVPRPTEKKPTKAWGF